jgi:hypothetical protein
LLKIILKNYCQEFNKSDENRELKQLISNIPIEKFDVPSKFISYKASWLTQLILLLKRCYLNYIRNYRVCANDIVMTFVRFYLTCQ